MRVKASIDVFFIRGIGEGNASQRELKCTHCTDERGTESAQHFGHFAITVTA
jgi:hypothetical protein